MPRDEEFKHLNIPLNGRLVTAVDGTQLGEGDFQILKNMRYGDRSPKSIGGMTKINVAAPLNKNFRKGFHFLKNQPYELAQYGFYQESHVIVQAFAADLIHSVLYQQVSNIPYGGDFETALYDEGLNANTGMFSNAPDGCMAYANAHGAFIWGGNEYRCAGFVLADDSGNPLFDFTEKINNILQDANNIAVLRKASGTGTVDADTMMLLHLDNNVTDSTSGPRHVPTNTDVTFSSSVMKWSYSGLFNGTSAKITVSDALADFNFSDGTWTIDLWVRPDSSGGATQTVFFQRTDDNNYIALTLIKLGSLFRVKLSIFAAGVEKLGASGFFTAGYHMASGNWYHLEVVENGDDYYIFINGYMRAYNTYTGIAPAAYTGSVLIGVATFAAGSQNYFKGYIDEFRVSSNSRHTDNFTSPTAPYASSGGQAYVYVASTRSIKGGKFYKKVANGSAGTVSVVYWGNAGWTSVPGPLVDGTSSGGKTLAQTGIISFGTTVGLAKPRMFNGVYAYWYLFTFNGIDDTTSVYYVTLDAPFQLVVDLWDGIYRSISSFFRYTTRYLNMTSHVFEKDYVTGDTITYVNVGTMTPAMAIYCGFLERMAGLFFGFAISDLSGTTINRVNTNSLTIAVSRWNGSAWTEVDGLNDGTRQETDSFGKNGTVTWDPPEEADESKTSIAQHTEEVYYYYKITFSAALSANVYIDIIQGIPVQKSIHAYRCPVIWQNRLFLLGGISENPNGLICSSQDTVCVFNGSDAIEPSAPMKLGGGEPLIAGATLYTRFAQGIYENLVVMKKNEVWVIDGTSPEDYRKYQVASNFGCTAPGTLVSCDTGYEISPGVRKHVLIWQTDSDIVLFDGNAISPISDDIENYFDTAKSECINSAMIDKSAAFYDARNYEYHWLFASGSSLTLDKEFVYDIRRKKWYETDRSPDDYLQIGFSVRDILGNSYCYGGIDKGFILQLDNGTGFPNAAILNPIVSTYRTGDFSLGPWHHISKIRFVKHIAIAKSITTATVGIVHYGDTLNAATAISFSHEIKSTTKRVVEKIESVDWGNFNYHSIQCSITTKDEKCAYEPLGIAIKYKIIREEFTK